jgi:hypothetical protein
MVLSLKPYFIPELGLPFGDSGEKVWILSDGWSVRRESNQVEVSNVAGLYRRQSLRK